MTVNIDCNAIPRSYRDYIELRLREGEYIENKTHWTGAAASAADSLY